MTLQTFTDYTNAAVAAAAPFEQAVLGSFMGSLPESEKDDLIAFEDPDADRTVERLLVRAWASEEARDPNNRNLGGMREKARDQFAKAA